jgi:alkylation response protein AidB-like acyl-CoA dehydrogenase
MSIDTVNIVEPTAAAGSLRDRVTPGLEDIAARASETEQARRVPVENIDIIRDAGFVRAFAPRDRGGDERDMWDYVDGVRAVAKACPSTGWVTGVLNVHQSIVPHFNAEIRDKVWETGPDTIICSSGTPAIKAKLVDGGVVVNGKGQWSSGSDHAEWAIVGLKVPDVSDARYPERRYRPMMFMAHRSEYTIEDVWYAEAMRGTGSNNLVFDDLFLSWDRLEGLDAMTFGYSRGQGDSDSWITHIPFPIHFSCFFPAVALGCADAMIEEFTKRQKGRKNAYTGAAGILNPGGHMRLAESVHEIESLTVYYRKLMDDIQEYGMQRTPLNEEHFSRLLHRLPFVAERAVQVVQRLFVGAGSSAIGSASKFQRYWRDAHACRLHTGMDYDTYKQLAGRNMLGLMPTPDL